MGVLITKMNGEKEPFQESKLDQSLARAGASENIRNEIVTHIVDELEAGMTTQEIHEHAFDLLRERERQPVAARYSIKRAVLDLGPSGFPFEQFLGQVFDAIGYTDVQIGVAAQGKCAPHEVDLMARHEDKHVVAEAKFHNSLGIKTDLKVALYVKARFEDLSKRGTNVDEGWLITNTRFTRNAIRFGNCAGLQMLGWDYPRGRGLEVLINEAGVHPLTALTSISEKEKQAFLDDDIVLCRQVPFEEQVLKGYGVQPDKHASLKNEVTSLCAPHKITPMTES